MRVNTTEKIIYTTLTAAVACMIGGGLIHHFPEGLSLFAGALWGSLNLFFLKNVMEKILLKKGQSGSLFLLICIKWPLMYLAGYALLKTHYLSSLYLLLGFSLIFLTIFIFGCVGVLKSNEK